MTQTQTKEIWLLFREGNHPLKYFLRKEYGHVYILMRDNYKFWNVIDPADSYLKFSVLNFNPTDDVPHILNKKGVRILKVTVKRIDKRTQGIRLCALINCVSIAKYVLGVKFLAFTPYQLYKKLVRMQRTKQYDQTILDVTQLV